MVDPRSGGHAHQRVWEDWLHGIRWDSHRWIGYSEKVPSYTQCKILETRTDNKEASAT